MSFSWNRVPGNRLLICLAVGLMQLLGAAASDAAGPRVVANGEELRGDWTGHDGGIAVFRGIPFAQPPVADLRWRPPRPHEPRGGAPEATGFAPACMQGPGAVDWYAGVAQAFGHGPEVVGRPNGVSEDCLYLNVWTPQPGEAGSLPVMVFVHGGSNSGGWSYEPNYVGSGLAARGVVVVTVAYRLGPFGFFAHPALTADGNDASANFGLLDIRAAFRWVADHIAAFGGDPGNITAFGESAGAFDLLDLALAENTRAGDHAPLFRRLVLQSIGGSLTERQTVSGERQIGLALAKQLGFGEDVPVESLRQIPPEKLVAATAALPPEHYFDAVVDEQTLPVHPLEVLRRAQARGIEVIVGTNEDEALMYLDDDVAAGDIEDWIARNAPQHREALQALAASAEDLRPALNRFISARDYHCPAQYVARQANAGGGSGWVYRFTRRRPGAGGKSLGAYHGAELPYVFNRHDDWLPTGQVDRDLTAAVQDYWVQFARYGDPNLPGRPAWPKHTRSNPAVLELGDRVGEMENDSESLCGFLWPGEGAEQVKQ